jgi:MarR family transcriptional regulator, temperature-dependent positive regulator of motility
LLDFHRHPSLLEVVLTSGLGDESTSLALQWVYVFNVANHYLSDDREVKNAGQIVKKDKASQLLELALLVHGVGRQLGLPPGLQPGGCTPVETLVMRFIYEHPGTGPGEASKGTLLPSSNFSRALRSLESKGLLRRQTHSRDARSVRLYLTALAEEDFKRMRNAWSRALEGIITDPGAVELVNDVLRKIEKELIARRRRNGKRIRTVKAGGC